MIISMLFWGIAWSVGKVAVEHSSVELASFYRYAISFVAMIPIIYYLKIPFKTHRRGVMLMIIAGILTAIFNYLFFSGLKVGDAGYGGTLVTSLSPILTYILSIIFFSLIISTREIIALSIGILGALLILKVPQFGLGFISPQNSYFLIAALVWAFVTIVSQKSSKYTSPMLYTLVVFGVAMLSNLTTALPQKPFDISSLDSMFWLSVLFLGIFPGAIGTTLFFVSAQKIGAHKTGIYMFIVPIGAIGSSIIMFDEKIEFYTIIGCLLAFIAVFLFNMNKRPL